MKRSTNCGTFVLRSFTPYSFIRRNRSSDKALQQQNTRRFTTAVREVGSQTLNLDCSRRYEPGFTSTVVREYTVGGF